AATSDGYATTLRGEGEDASAFYRAGLADPAVAPGALFGLAVEAVRGGDLAVADSFLHSGARSPQGNEKEYAAEVEKVIALRESHEAGDHIAIANWFAQHSAFDAAFDEGEVALALDPANEDAMAFLSNLAINEKAGLLFFTRYGADRGFRLSELRR